MIKSVNFCSIKTAKALYRVLVGTTPQQAISIIGGCPVAELLQLETAFVRYSRVAERSWASLRLALWHRLSLTDYDTAIGLLDRCRPSLSSAEFNRLIDAETNSVVHSGSAQLLFDGVNSFAKRLQLIDSSTETIDFQTFYFANDDAGQLTAEALIAAVKRGVRVRLICDWKASLFSARKIFTKMQKAGVKIQWYATPVQLSRWLNCWHEKILVTDGQFAIVGGMNIADEYMYGGTERESVRNWQGHYGLPWRDADVLVTGSIAMDVRFAFEKNWQTLSGGLFSAMNAGARNSNVENVAGEKKIRFIQHRPAEDRDRNLLMIYLQAVRCASRSIWIETFLIIPPAILEKALINAARRGVEVIILTNSRSTSDIKPVMDVCRFRYKELLKAGVQIYEHRKQTIHAKTMTIDSQMTVVGSYNLNNRSERFDSENLMVIDDPDIAAQNEQRIDQGIAEAERLSPCRIAFESNLGRLRRKVLSSFAWAF